jgi:hypothetical protein
MTGIRILFMNPRNLHRYRYWYFYSQESGIIYAFQIYGFLPRKSNNGRVIQTTGHHPWLDDIHLKTTDEKQ